MRTRYIGLVLFIVSLLFASVCFSSEGWDGKKAPEFSLPDVNGNVVSLAELTGKKVVWINFWGLRCGPCIRELPALEAIYKKYQDKGLLILGVNADGVDSAFIKKSFEDRADLKDAGVTFPLVADPDFKLVDAYELMGAPLNVMIDKTGVVAFHHEGYEAGDEVKYEELVKTLLAK